MFDNKNQLISRIIEIEYQITSEISKGHKPFFGDHLESLRQEVDTLRCIVFGYDSPYCKKKLVDKN